jgi:exonuclease III
MLDHVLVSRALLAWYRGSEVDNEALGDEVGASQVAARPNSLHAPVVAAFERP